MHHNLTKIDVLEKELKELKLEKDRLRIQQKEIYSNIFNLPNFQYFFPGPLTWIYKNLIKISDDFPEDIFPSYLTESDILYLKNVSEVELEIEEKNLENRMNKTINFAMNKKYSILIDPNAKMSEVQDKLKEYKRQSLVVKELDSRSIDLRKMNEFQSDFQEEEMDVGNLNGSNNFDHKITNSDRFSLENTSNDVKKLIFQRSKSKKDLKTQIFDIEKMKSSQIKLERFYDEKNNKINELKHEKIKSFLQEYNPKNLDERSLKRLQQRALAVFGVKDGEKFLEENYEEHVSYKKNDKILTQNQEGHSSLEKKMEKLKKIRFDEESQTINYRFNPIYNRFPDLISENNINSTFLSRK